MHLILALFSIFAAWRWSDWRNWKQYHATMIFITAGGFLYEFLTVNKALWVFHPDFLYNQTITIIVYAIVTMPLSVLLFLSTYPKTIGKQIRHLLTWIGIYVCGELILQYMGRISYQNGWSLWHSILFDMMMFPMIRLHHTRPLLAYAISVLITLLLMTWFQIESK